MVTAPCSRMRPPDMDGARERISIWHRNALPAEGVVALPFNSRGFGMSAGSSEIRLHQLSLLRKALIPFVARTADPAVRFMSGSWGAKQTRYAQPEIF